MPSGKWGWFSCIGGVPSILADVDLRMWLSWAEGRSTGAAPGDQLGDWSLEAEPLTHVVSILQIGPSWWGGGLFVLVIGLGSFWYGRHCRPRWWRQGMRWVRDVLTGAPRRAGREARGFDTVLHQNTLRLRERLEAKTALFASTVHDLKTPLLGIRQLSVLVLEDATLSEDGQRKLELIRATADEAMGRVDQLLSTTADEEGMLGWGSVNLGTLVKDVVHRLRPHAEYKEQILRYRLPDSSCRVEGDELRLQEAVGNLVSNALKYSPQGETIEVEVISSAECVRISVSDNGPGLSESDQKRLFSPFQRLTPQPTGNERSSGVGLYITKQVMNLHRGDVEVVTAEGQGSTFTLVLPTTPSSRGEGRPRGVDSDAPAAVTSPEKKNLP